MPESESITMQIDASNLGAAGNAARLLADYLRTLDDVSEASLHKDNEATMDVGNIVQVVFASGATLALARGIATWLKARRDAHVTITVTADGVSIKTMVAGIDPATAERIIEKHLPGSH